jgi:CubicO group peptidase (beta-lactamase class C family)
MSDDNEQSLTQTVHRIRHSRNVGLLFLLFIGLSLGPVCSRDGLSGIFGGGQKDSDGPPEYDQAVLEQAFTDAGDILNLRSLLVISQGVTVGEEYFSGTDENDLHDVRSVTKSFLSALTGIAIHKGYLTGTAQTLGDFREALGLLDTNQTGITIEHLLTMTAGHHWREIGESSEFSRWVSASNQVFYILDKPIENTPGTVFNYSDGAAHLLSVILTTATGMNTSQLADSFLLKPLEIEPRPWLDDKQGYNFGGVGLQVTPADMAKLGLLYLAGGKYEGCQIVPEEWVRRSTKGQITTGNLIPFSSKYGYYWWIGREHGRDLYFANGYGGQFIVVVPDLELVMVATSNWNFLGTRATEQWYTILDMLINRVMPAML